jgi:bifunctional DNA-binding transcriptional regulator/antitoxin component of YhaV-PrlF toxin-antitoxin module
VNKETELIALATVYQDGTTVRGKIPASVVKALRAKGGDVLAFERQADGVVIVRKSTAAERKSPVKSPVSKKGAKR